MSDQPDAVRLPAVADIQDVRRQPGVVAGGVIFGLLAFGVALCTGWTISLLLSTDLLGKSASAALIADSGLWWQLIFIVILGPVFETLITQWLLLELLRPLQCKTVLVIIFCSLIFGLGHYLNGGLGHGLTAVSAGAVFTYAYLARRGQGVASAFWTAAVAHMVNNALALTIVTVGFA